MCIGGGLAPSALHSNCKFTSAAAAVSYSLRPPPGLTVSTLAASYAAHATERSVRDQGPLVPPQTLRRSEQTATIQAAIVSTGLALDTNIAMWAFGQGYGCSISHFAWLIMGMSTHIGAMVLLALRVTV